MKKQNESNKGALEEIKQEIVKMSPMLNAILNKTKGNAKARDEAGAVAEGESAEAFSGLVCFCGGGRLNVPVVVGAEVVAVEAAVLPVVVFMAAENIDEDGETACPECDVTDEQRCDEAQYYNYNSFVPRYEDVGYVEEIR
ncbi:unnamed protein product [Heligmosomoides polygyrus]|uniref:Uncharacterized protein n=1 Tax=Heligmosomoides polygyrus TaxID=6339 RepID=A0A183G6R5_HELPZ|nr:unnamed protein product [Heligmosomoides polygyrus]